MLVECGNIRKKYGFLATKDQVLYQQDIAKGLYAVETCCLEISNVTFSKILWNAFFVSTWFIIQN